MISFLLSLCIIFIQYVDYRTLIITYAACWQKQVKPCLHVFEITVHKCDVQSTLNVHYLVAGEAWKQNVRQAVVHYPWRTDGERSDPSQILLQSLYFTMEADSCYNPIVSKTAFRGLGISGIRASRLLINIWKKSRLEMSMYQKVYFHSVPKVIHFPNWHRLLLCPWNTRRWSFGDFLNYFSVPFVCIRWVI